MDLAVIPLYCFGVMAVINHRAEWKLVFAAASPQATEFIITAEYYALICAAGLHAVSLCTSCWLGLMFKRIASMPPDMNPLESHLTSRVKQHKRNKSSVATSYTTLSEDSKRMSTPLENYRSSGAAYEDLSRPPSIPFMHTRSGSRDSFASKRDSRSDLPSRQYQVTPGNSPRDSVAGSLADLKRLSTPRLAQRGSYTEVPLHETNVASPSPSPSRPSSVTIAPSPHQPHNASPTRIAKFTEAWYASESLINRTQERNRAVNAEERRKSRQSQQYEAVNQRYDFNDSDEDDSDRENMMRPGDSDAEDPQSSPINVSGQMHPNPLRLHPVPTQTPEITTPTKDVASRQKTPFRLSAQRDSTGALSEISLNDRRVSGSQDITDLQAQTTPTSLNRQSTAKSFWRRSLGGGVGRGIRNSSIQPDADFSAKSYGELKPATPPVMIGTVNEKKGRQVSSGNDYADLGAGNAWRRNVSGKVAEEGLAGNRYSRYSILNDD